MNMELLSSDFLRPDVEGSKWILASKFSELKNKFSDATPDTPKPKPKYKITADGKMIEVSAADTNQSTTNQPLSETENTGNQPTPFPEKAEDTPLFRRTPSAVPKRKNEEEVKEKTPFEYQFKSDNTPSKAATVTTFATESAKPQKEKKKKASGNILKEFIIPILILGAIFGGWSYWNSKTGNASKETRESLNAMLNDQEGSKDLTGLAANSPENNTSDITTVPVQMPSTDTSAVIAPPPPKRNADSLARIAAANIAKKREDSIALAARNAEREKALAAEKEKAAKAAADKKAEEAKKATAANTNKTETTTKPAATTSADKKSGDVRDYVRLQLNNPAKDGFINAKIKVNNISNTKLDVAVVRVRYLDEKSNVLKSETVQVDNIPAGRSVIVSIPDNKGASKISYGVTMISGQDVYIMRK